MKKDEETRTEQHSCQSTNKRSMQLYILDGLPKMSQIKNDLKTLNDFIRKLLLHQKRWHIDLGHLKEVSIYEKQGDM